MISLSVNRIAEENIPMVIASHLGDKYRQQLQLGYLQLTSSMRPVMEITPDSQRRFILN